MTARSDHPADVLVLGAGPGGLFVAGRLAQGGIRTIVCEEHARIGDPVHCTGVLAAESFDEFDLPRDATLNELRTVQFVSPGGTIVEHSTPTAVAAVIDRPAFDRALARRAEAAGAQIRCGARVTSLDVHADGVSAMVGTERIGAKMAILACGANYAFQRQFGLGLPRTYLHTAQRELRASTPGDVELHFGRDVAPDGFAWAVPVQRREGSYVRVGVMAAAGALDCYRRMLERIGDRWGVSDRAQPPRLKILPLGAIDRTYHDRLLAIGDAAGLVKPTTGGGIHYSIVSAAIAAEVVADAVERNAFDAESLSAYERAWRRRLDREFEAQHELRRVASGLSDRAIDSFFELAHVNGIMPIVRATARFNEHRPLISALLKHPPARQILVRGLIG
jgi:digeranylgeranylglycerophospholipid reductase